MSVEALMDIGLEATTRAECEFARAESIVNTVDATEAAWRRWADGDRR